MGAKGGTVTARGRHADAADMARPAFDRERGTVRVPLTNGGEVVLPINEAIALLADAGGKAMDHAVRMHGYRERARAMLAPAGGADDVVVENSNAAVEVVTAESDPDEWERRGPGAWVAARVWVHDHDEFCAHDADA